MNRPERLRDVIPGLAGITWLNSASQGMPPRAALDAVRAQTDLLERGPRLRGWSDFLDTFERPVDDARREATRLLGARPDEVALVGDTTSGLHHAMDAIPFRSGDNVVVSDLEYPQVALAAQNAARSDGVEVRTVRHRGGRIAIDDVRAAVDSRTRALLVSSVSWVTGQRLDLATLSALARERDLFLVVDAVQHLGSLSIDTAAYGVDFLTAGGYKWLNAPFGVGVLYVRRETHGRGLRLRRLGLLGLETPAGGWSSYYGSPELVSLPPMSPAATARRFEAQGTPNRVGCAGFAAALALRNGLRPSDVDRHILDLGGRLIEELHHRGARIVTPEDERERAGIVTFTFGEPADDTRLRELLETRGIYVSTRYCAGAGGVRAAVHVFNDTDDVDRLLSTVDEFRENPNRESTTQSP